MVNINTVYQRVQTLANKEQRGYITPQEFNILANQAQIEIFEQYFYDTNQFGRLHGNSTEYGDMLKLLSEKIAIFEKQQAGVFSSYSAPGYLATYGTTIVTNGNFETNVSNWTVANGTQTHYTTVGTQLQLKNDAGGDNPTSTQTLTTVANKVYRIKATIDAAGLNTSAGNASGKASVTFGGASSSSVPVGSSSTIEFFHTATGTSTDLVLKITATGNTADFALFDTVTVQEVSGTTKTIPISNLYRLGSVFTVDSNNKFIELAQVLPNELIYVSSSPLTKPTASRPVYVRKNFNEITIHPSTLSNDSLFINYVKKPDYAEWAYTVTNEKAVYDATNSKNFELHTSEETALVYKILGLAGIAIQRPDLANAGLNKETKEMQNEKS